MRHAFLWAAVVTLVLFALVSAAAAQEDSSISTAPVSSVQTLVASNSATPAFASVRLLSPDALPAVSGSLDAVAAPSDPASPQVGVINVTPSYSFQAYGGYTFVRYYAFPGREVNRNGFDISMSYFFKKGLFGVEGALTTTFGSIGNNRSDFVFAGGGPRVRWSAPRGLEVWAHGLIGGANFGPSIAGFSQSGLAYELGGGVDITAHFRRLAYRLEADMIGTRLYNTSQYSPKFSVGLVYKF